MRISLRWRLGDRLVFKEERRMALWTQAWMVESFETGPRKDPLRKLPPRITEFVLKSP